MDHHQLFLNTVTPLLLASTSTSDHLAHWRQLPPLLELCLCRTHYLQRLGQSPFTLEKKAAHVAFPSLNTAVHLRSNIDKRCNIPSWLFEDADFKPYSQVKPFMAVTSGDPGPFLFQAAQSATGSSSQVLLVIEDVDDSHVRYWHQHIMRTFPRCKTTELL